VSRYFEILRKGQDQADEIASEPLDIQPRHDDKIDAPPEISVEQVHVQPASRIVCHTEPTGPGADRFRYLRMRLRNVWNAGTLRALLITSPLPGDGKSTIALNLATVLAEHGNRSVLLIEADLHHPTLSQQLNIETKHGLAECLEDAVDPVSLVRRLEPLGWYLLPSGSPRSNPSELLHGESFSGIIQQLSPHFDWILIDSPPVVPLTDTLSLAQQVDASLVVARAGCTPREAIERTLELLGPERVLGIILNGVEGLHRLYSKYYGHYHYSASSAATRPIGNPE
jgi:protein-tyrosine kinase